MSAASVSSDNLAPAPSLSSEDTGAISFASPREFLRDLYSSWEPPKVMTVSEWADSNLMLSSEYAAHAGKWTTLSFQRGPLDAVSDPTVRQVVIRSCTQLLKTSVIQSAIGWVIDIDPGPILVIQPRDSDAKAFSKERIAPMLRDTPCLSVTGKVADYKHSSDNTIEEKWFRGGMLAITSAGSAANLARRAIRYLFCDEEDKWVASAGVEGKPFDLAAKRTATFRHRAKMIRCCSPTRSGSANDLAYESSDKREFYVPCPKCGEKQSMMGKFRTNVVWDNTLPKLEDRARSARYRCDSCDALWDEADRLAAVENGEWRAHRPFEGTAGFWISQLYSPWKSLSETVLEFLKAKDNTESLMVFTNTALAENWSTPGDSLDWQRLLSQRESYPVGLVPAGGLFLTAGVDIQKDRIEAEIVAWGRNRESWSVCYEILMGDVTEKAVWAQLDSLLSRTFPTSDGAQLLISRAFIDSGHFTNEVYRWASTQPTPRIQLVKGDDRSDLPVGQPSPILLTTGGKKIRSGMHLRRIRVSDFKQELYSWLSKRPPTAEQLKAGAGYPLGYCHFPIGPNYGDEHFQQLCAERYVETRNPRDGRIRYSWQLIAPNAANHALDARNYARAASWDLGMDRMHEAQWKRLEEQIQSAARKPEQTSNSSVSSPSSSDASHRSQSSGSDSYWGEERSRDWWGG